MTQIAKDTGLGREFIQNLSSQIKTEIWHHYESDGCIWGKTSSARV